MSHDFLLFAGYTWAPRNSNKCPATFSRIATADACSVAAAANGKTYAGQLSDPTASKGCFWYQEFGSNDVFFNSDPVGSADPSKLPLCIGAPLRRQCVRCADATSANAAACATSCGPQQIRRHAAVGRSENLLTLVHGTPPTDGIDVRPDVLLACTFVRVNPTIARSWWRHELFRVHYSGLSSTV